MAINGHPNAYPCYNGGACPICGLCIHEGRDHSGQSTSHCTGHIGMRSPVEPIVDKRCSAMVDKGEMVGRSDIG